MPQPTKGPRLGGSPAHQRLILANLATSLFQHRKITTTEAKARRLRPYAEKLITKAKRGDLHNIREIGKVIRDKDVIHALIHEIGPFFADREGGYTRITKTLPRKGDNAPMAVIELVAQKTVTDEADRARRSAGSRGKAAPAADTTAGIKAVLDELQTLWPKTKLLVLSVFPRGEGPEDKLRKLNDEINVEVAKLADNKKIFVQDISASFMAPDGTLPKEIMPDKLHLSPQGYELWAKAIDPKLKELGL